MKKPMLLLAGLAMAGLAAAEFTDAEKTAIRRLVEHGIAVRARAAAAPVYELASISSASAHLNRAVYYLIGAIAERNPTARQTLASSPRSEYLRRAWAEIEASGEAVNLDRSLAFADIFPADHLTLPERVVGPHGPYVDTVTHGWRSGGHYSQDGTDDMVAALMSGEPCPCDGPLRDSLARQVIRQGFLVQDAELRAAARYARVGLTAAEVEQEQLDPRTFVLRPLRDNTRIAPQHFHNVMVLLAQLAEMPLGPIWRARVSSAILHYSDAWRQGNFEAWEAMRIPETGI